MEPLGDWLADCPWKSRAVCLLLVSHSGETVEQAFNVEAKRELLATQGIDHFTVIAVWGGQWSTTARVFADGDAATVREALA